MILCESPKNLPGRGSDYPAATAAAGPLRCEHAPMPFRRGRRGSKSLPQYELASLRDEMDALALKVASGLGVKLDHTPESIKKVEKILGTLHDEYARTGSDEGMNGVALEFAAYIVRVIELNFEPGEWRRGHPEFGPDSFPYHWRGKDVFPFAWCRKRILDGPDDDVWAKFNVLIQHPT